jgi:hypothetical protein
MKKTREPLPVVLTAEGAARARQADLNSQPGLDKPNHACDPHRTAGPRDDSRRGWRRCIDAASSSGVSAQVVELAAGTKIGIAAWVTDQPPQSPSRVPGVGAGRRRRASGTVA